MHSKMRATLITAATPAIIAIIILSSSPFSLVFLSLLGSLLLKLLEVRRTVVASPSVDSVGDTSVAVTAVELSVGTGLALDDVFCEIGDDRLVD